MSESNVSLWFDSPRTWVIPVLGVKDGAMADAAQIGGPEAVWTFGARYPEDVPALMEGQVGDWVVETEDGHRHLFTDAVFRDQFAPNGIALKDLHDQTKTRAHEHRILAGYQEGEAYHRDLAVAQNLLVFSEACLQLAERNAWPNSSLEDRPVIPVKTDADAARAAAERREKIMDGVEKMRKAFAGELPLTVWITKTVRQEFPVDMVQKVMRAISDHGGESGGNVVFDSVGRHRDTALDAILRSSSEYTMGIPIEDSLSQKQWESRGIRASSRMVDLTREILAPLEMAAIRQANPGEVVALPFNQDGFFDEKVNEVQRNPQMNHGQGDC